MNAGQQAAQACQNNYGHPHDFSLTEGGECCYCGFNDESVDLVAPEDKRDALGTFACPICGYDQPHSHTAVENTAYIADQVRDDGWVSTAKKRPQESGWYLCAEVSVQPKSILSDAHDSQLHWFLWVRDGASRDGASIPEVLYYDRSEDRWSLRNLLGNASYSGAESRWIVTASPGYWREIPSLNINVEATAAAPTGPSSK